MWWILCGYKKQCHRYVYVLVMYAQLLKMVVYIQRIFAYNVVMCEEDIFQLVCLDT